MNIIFVGAQGSGKGTQAAIISKEIGLAHISTGDLFRNAQGELKKELDSYMLSGKLVPDELVLKMLKERLSKEDCSDGFILDGFPRNLSQAESLDSITNIDKVIEIEISDEESVKRLSGRVSCKNCKAGYNLFTEPKPQNPEVCDKCGGELVQRADDNPEAIRARLKIYHDETEPILKHYPSVKINGEQSIENVTQDILVSLE